jgi:hypothetical protein
LRYHYFNGPPSEEYTEPPQTGQYNFYHVPGDTKEGGNYDAWNDYEIVMQAPDGSIMKAYSPVGVLSRNYWNSNRSPSYIEGWTAGCWLPFGGKRPADSDVASTGNIYREDGTIIDAANMPEGTYTLISFPVPEGYEAVEIEGPWHHINNGFTLSSSQKNNMTTGDIGVVDISVAIFIRKTGAAPEAAVQRRPELETATVDPPPSAPPVSGFNTGDYLGDVLYSDINAFINGYPIPTSITNGRTMVVVEDLANYGFDVVWDAAAWSLSVYPNADKTITPLPLEINTFPVGTVKCPYVYTTVKTYLSGEEAESFAIDGRTLIDFELLAKYGQVSWDGAARELKLTLN